MRARPEISCGRYTPGEGITNKNILPWERNLRAPHQWNVWPRLSVEKRFNATFMYREPIQFISAKAIKQSHLITTRRKDISNRQSFLCHRRLFIVSPWQTDKKYNSINPLTNWPFFPICQFFWLKFSPTLLAILCNYLCIRIINYYRHNFCWRHSSLYIDLFIIFYCFQSRSEISIFCV